MDDASLVVVTYKYNSKIRGYHVYQEVWTPFLGETLPCSPEDGNPHDPFCVKVTKRDVGTVGHLPITISSSCSVFLQMGGAISCRVTGSRCYSRDLNQGGLEIPCVLVFQGSNCLVSKAKKMLQLCEQKPNNIKATTAQDTPMEALKDGEDLPGDPAKKIKVEEEESTSRCDHNNEDVWLYHKIRLLNRNAMSNGRQLNDKHINFAQIILKEKFPDITGLQLTLLQTKFKLDIRMPLVQILHVHGNHWITISNLQCEAGKILIYDSIFNTVDSQVRQLVENICGSEINTSIHGKMLGPQIVVSLLLLLLPHFYME